MKVIRRLAADSGNVGFGAHARERMVLRGITDRDALGVLRAGEVKGNIEAGKARGEWKCKVTAPIKGSREAGVVTIVWANKKLFVKTVEWEDP